MIDLKTDQTETSATKESKGKRAVVPMVLAGVGALAVATKMLKGSKKNGVEFKSHAHASMEHTHPHVHVTHERTDADAPVGGWTHLTAEHSHRHNHASVEHSHRPHQDVESEHLREAHIHDHEHPTS